MADAAMDWNALRTRTLNDAALMAELLRLFLSEMTSGLAKFDALADGQDLPAVSRLAHRLKGSAATIGATTLAGLYRQAETDADAGDAASAFALLPRIKAEVARCFAEIDARSA